MKRFDFRLERLLGLEKQMEQLAEQRQHQARAVFEAATAEVLRAEMRLEEAGSGGMEELRQDAALGSWQTRSELRVVLEQAVTIANKHANVSFQRLQAAHLERTRIATKVESLNHLRQEQLRVHRIEVARREYAQLDEVGMRRWLDGANTRRDGESPQGDEG